MAGDREKGPSVHEVDAAYSKWERRHVEEVEIFITYFLFELRGAHDAVPVLGRSQVAPQQPCAQLGRRDARHGLGK